MTHGLNIKHVSGNQNYLLRNKFCHLSKGKGKVMMDAFFDVQGFVHYEFAAEG
jgi:hypothetical protein